METDTLQPAPNRTGVTWLEDDLTGIVKQRHGWMKVDKAGSRSCAPWHRQAPVRVRPSDLVWAISAALAVLTWSVPGWLFAGENGASGNPAAMETAEETRAGLVEPIITEETLPNEPRELALRLSSEYRKKGGEVTAVALCWPS